MPDVDAPRAASRTRLLVTVLLLVVVAAAVVLVATQLRSAEPSGPTARSVVEAVFQPPPERADAAVVQICVAQPGACAAPGSATSAREMPGLDGDVEARVIPYGTADTAETALELWENNELTSDWQGLDGLDGPAAPRPE